MTSFVKRFYRNFHETYNIGIFIILLALFISTNFAGEVKYIISLILLVGLLGFYVIRKKAIKTSYISFFLILAAPSVFSIVYSLLLRSISKISDVGSYFLFFAKDSFFMVFPLILAFFSAVVFYKKKINIVRLLFICISAQYILVSIYNLISYILNNMPISMDTFESVNAFIFGAYVIYFIYKREEKNFTIASIVLMFFSHKRIVYLAVIACLLIMLMLRFINDNIKSKIIKFRVFEILFIISGLFFVSSIADQFYQTLMQKLKVIDNGRLFIYKHFFDDFVFTPGYFGKGIGFVAEKLNYINSINNYHMMALLHSDILKYYIELGFLGFIVFIVLMFWFVQYALKNVNNQTALLYAILISYTLLNFFTDNISIYIVFLYPFYTILIYEFLLNRKQDNILYTKGREE